MGTPASLGGLKYTAILGGVGFTIYGLMAGVMGKNYVIYGISQIVS